jgi:DHA3 family tetracycline resistance protein-like MFS transporter
MESLPGPAIEPSWSRIGILRPLRIRDFRLLWAGMSISLIGDGIYLVAIALQVYSMSDNPSDLALVGLAWTGPMVLVLLFSGVLSDRLERRRLLIVADAIRCAAIGSMGILTSIGVVRLWHLVALAAVYGIGEAIFYPAFSSLVPDLVAGDELRLQANSLAQFMRPFAQTMLGPAIGGFLVQGLGAGSAFLADAGTFAFSAVMVSLIRARGRPSRDGEATSAGQDLVEGIRYVRRHTWLLVAMLAATVNLLFFWGPFEVLVPFVVKRVLGGSGAELGLIFAAGGAAAVVTAVVMGQRALPRRPLTVMYAAWGLATFALVGFGIADELWPMYLVSAASSACITVLMIVWTTLMQRMVPARFLGRVSSLDWMLSTAGTPASYALTGPVSSILGPQATLVAAGSVGAVVVLLAAVVVPGARAPERDGSLLAASAP